MSEILFLSHRIPFPPDRGDKIRSHHLLRRLASIAPVHVATFADDDADAASEADLALLAASWKLVRRTRPVPLAGLLALAQGKPVSLTAFHHAALAAYVEETLRLHPISTIFVFSGQMGQYIPSTYRGRVIVDFVDVDSAKFEAYGQTSRFPMNLVHAREGRLLMAEEARLAARADISLLVSPEEAALFRTRLRAPLGADIRALGNGIDAVGYDPVLTAPEPRLAALSGPPLIFTGQMDYAPNVAAVIRAATRIMPLIRSKVPDATFHVVGRNPVEAVSALHGLNGTHVWGRVDDVRPWLRAADLALVPLDLARGVQNKVLEAMAMALPVVASIEAATGIAATPARDFAVGQTDAELAAAAISLLLSRPRARAMGLAARRYVERNHNWAAVLAPLAGMVEVPPRGGARRAA